MFLGALFFSGLGVAYASQVSYPGEVLYPVKVGVTEQIESVVTVDTASEAELQAKLFAERIEEVAKLHEKGQFNSEVANEHRKKIGERFQKAFNLIEELEENGDMAEATVARAIMQTAIEYHMHSDALSDRAISHDLDLYSKIMTESFISTSTKTDN